ncbi:MAG TPA: carbohydrate porin [Rhodanobacteraceae bacterium]
MAATPTRSTRVTGTSFIDLVHVDATRGGQRATASGDRFDVKRLYLSLTHQFDQTWSAAVTTDFNYASTGRGTRFFVKKAYVQGRFGKLAVLRIGSANTPWIAFVEHWYGYRFVENTLIDRLKFGNSADWGVHLLGNDGRIDYQVSVLNGAGYRDPSPSHSVDVAARVGYQPINGLVIAAGAYAGDRGKGTTAAPALRRAQRYDAMIAYAAHGIRVGAEWFRATDWNHVAKPGTDAARGWSLWGSYAFGAASVFARYDRALPSRRLDASLVDTYYNAGIAFRVSRNLRVAVAYKDEKLQNGSTPDIRSREIGVWGAVQF